MNFVSYYSSFLSTKAQKVCQFDAIGAQISDPERGDYSTMERMRGQLLAEMDGFEELKNVLVLAATNNPNIIHPALLRPGRFDKLLYIPPPDKDARLNILKIHTKRKKIAEDVKLEHLADISAGSVGADLQALVNEAAMFSLREYLIKHEENSEFENNIAELNILQMRHFEQAKEKINLRKVVENNVDAYA